MDEKDKVEEVIRTVKEKAEPVLKTAKEKAEPVIKQALEAAEPVLKTAKEKAEPVVRQAKEKADPVIKKTKTRSQKAAKNIKEKVAEVTCKHEVYIQYGDREIRTEDILDIAKTDYLEKGHDKADLKEIQIYIKPYDNAAYYVVNHAETGKVSF